MATELFAALAMGYMCKAESRPMRSYVDANASASDETRSNPHIVYMEERLCNHCNIPGAFQF